MTALEQKHCVPCEGGTPPVSGDQLDRMMSEVPGWQVLNGKLTRNVKVKNFKEALRMVNGIGEIAEQENHHPDLQIHGWNQVKIELSTHAIGGLSENDFILAAKITELINQPGAGSA